MEGETSSSLCRWGNRGPEQVSAFWGHPGIGDWLPDPVPLSHPSQEAHSHPHPGYPAPLRAPRAPHAHRPWASSADLGPHHFAAELTRGASCQLGQGLHPCPHHSLRPAGRPGPCSQTRTPSGTLHLPTPSGEALRTAGRRPKTWVPRPHGCRRQALEWAAAPPCSSCPGGASIHWKRSQASLCSCLDFPQGPHPLWGSGTLHCTGSLHTGWGACTPPHTQLQPVGPPTYLPHWGLTLYPAGWEDHSLSQGIAPRGGAGRRGGARERGQPQRSPALLTKPCYCGPCLRA